MSDEKVKLIMFGLGGSVMFFNNNYRREGYADPEDLFMPYHWWADPPEKMTYHVDPEAAEGAMVIDKLPALVTARGLAFVFLSPLVNVDLKAGEIDRVGDLSKSIMAQTVKRDPGNAYGTLVRLHEAGEKVNPKNPGPLDGVDMWTYAKMWKKVGARVGVVRDGKIEWEE
jgi:hypothetical protein